MQKNWSIFWYAVYAFLGVLLGEIIFLLEPGDMPVQMHWIIASVVYGLYGYWLSHRARMKFGFYISKKRVSTWKNVTGAWVLAFVMPITYVCTQHTWHVCDLFRRLGFVAGASKVIYIIAMSFLYCLMICFSQDFIESERPKASRFAWGGVFCAIFSFMLYPSIESLVGGFIYGWIYMLTGRNFTLTWILVIISMIL